MTDFPPLPRYLTLDEAAQAMTDRTGKSWTARQILGCAERHEITVFARIGHAVKFVRVRPIEGKTNEIAAEAGSLPILDTKAIQALLLTGEARSRGWEELTTIDFFGEPAQAWTTVFELAPGEQAPRVRADDCRVTANGVLRLVESYTAPAQPQGEAETLTQSAPAAPDGQAWTLRQPQRFRGYRAPLYRFLKAAQAAGQPCPKARDVLEAWRDARPDEVFKVLPGELHYYDAEGNAATATTAAVQKAIDRLTEREKPR